MVSMSYLFPGLSKTVLTVLFIDWVSPLDWGFIYVPWGIIEMFFRKSCNPWFRMLTLSIRIFPVGSDSLNKAVINDDFPAPVRPTIPILSLASVLKLMFFKISLEFSSYLNETFWNDDKLTTNFRKHPEN